MTPASCDMRQEDRTGVTNKTPLGMGHGKHPICAVYDETELSILSGLGLAEDSVEP